MGYRSEVVLAIRAGVEVPPEIQADLDAIFPDERRVATGVLYHNGWVKWYGYDINDNPEPTRITRWLDLLDWDDFHFMRMGEDDGDMEEDGDVVVQNRNRGNE